MPLTTESRPPAAALHGRGLAHGECKNARGRVAAAGGAFRAERP